VVGKDSLTAVENADFLEDVNAIAGTCPGRRSQREIIASSDGFALQNDGQDRSNSEQNQERWRRC
jgi:hypothetical protein